MEEYKIVTNQFNEVIYIKLSISLFPALRKLYRIQCYLNFKKRRRI